MKATTNIHKAEIITTAVRQTVRLPGRYGNTLQAPEIQAGAATKGHVTGSAESELRAAARRHGLNLKQLAVTGWA